jgi:nitronate monooxygenase
MLKKANGRVDGFVVETRTAGGHNAPPRGKMQLSETEEPIYGERDTIDIGKFRELGVPFWLAGGYGHPEKLRKALEQGAAGIQVGTAFEFANESGLSDTYKQALLAKVAAGHASVFTDPLASPTGFPFKVAVLQGTVSDPDVYAMRPRICDLGVLREAYRTPEGGIGYRCAGEPATLYVSKGGNVDDTVGRKCVCNGLLANVGFPGPQRKTYRTRAHHGRRRSSDGLALPEERRHQLLRPRRHPRASRRLRACARRRSRN